MNQQQRDDLEDKIKDIYEDCNAEFRLGSRKFTDALARRIVAAVIVQNTFLFKFINHLIEEGFHICVVSEGENLDDEQAREIDAESPYYEGEFRTLEDPYKIYEQTQAVDECHLMAYSKPCKVKDGKDLYTGYVFIVNGNDEGEDVCDYSICGREDGGKPLHTVCDEYLDRFNQ